MSTGGPRGELTRLLREGGALAAEWVEVFEAVPRGAFLPDVIWPYDMGSGASRVVDRRVDGDAWERAAYADVPVTTQWDDGAHEGPGPGHVPTSSASMPSVVAGMLRDLDVRPGMRVLEVGTGTGWNAGLLAARLGGSGGVVTVEVDEAVAVRARAALVRAGLRAEVVCGDGRDGWAAGAPYDRLIATAGVRALPAAWLEQTRPGGVVLAPWGTHYGNGDALVRLTVRGDGTASGPFLRPVEFMKLRAQRLDWGRFRAHVGPYPGDADTSETAVSLTELGEGRRRMGGTAFVLGLLVPDCAHVLNTAGAGATLWFFDMRPGSRAWASAEFRPGATRALVRQSGTRRLWDEVTRALSWWQAQGTPPVSRFGLTADATGARQVWLDDDAHPVPAPGA
ncbi:methyltransferase domain-containing protein [Streptomyces sp. PRB2-1]|uniref:Protein-L-isoaspartate O-methyltransferase n=1 Tax=Actinacidiphila epipremni TaxID=2053013 RepID=A0ABX0ZF75_9ACTN|nr:methyltransferase domain-containing protein [Actinacidiphila epipremni]